MEMQTSGSSTSPVVYAADPPLMPRLITSPCDLPTAAVSCSVRTARELLTFFRSRRRAPERKNCYWQRHRSRLQQTGHPTATFCSIGLTIRRLNLTSGLCRYPEIENHSLWSRRISTNETRSSLLTGNGSRTNRTRLAAMKSTSSHFRDPAIRYQYPLTAACRSDGGAMAKNCFTSQQTAD